MVKKILILLLFIVSILSENNAAQSIAVKAFTDTTNYSVGDYIPFTIQVKAGKNIQLVTPSLKDSINNISLIKGNKPVEEEENGNRIITFSYVLSGYDSLTVTIPGIPIKFRTVSNSSQKSLPLLSDNDLINNNFKTAYTNPVTFTIHTLKVKAGGEIKDVKAPIKIPLDWKLILLWVLIALALAGTIFYLYRRYALKKAEREGRREVIKLPPHVIALSELDVLENQQLWQQGKIKEYHSNITEIIRRYFAGRFKLPALELTTSEAIDLLKGNAETQEIISITQDFLANADLVKFAKFSPMNSINEEMMKQAREIVQKTIPAENKETVEEAGNV